MKLHPDPSQEFANLAKTKYQRYTLYRLESSAASSPVGQVRLWCVLVILMSLGPVISGKIEFGWSAFTITLFGVYSVSEICFSRAIIRMLRNQNSKEEKINQQDAPSDGDKYPVWFSGFRLAADELDVLSKN